MIEVAMSLEESRLTISGRCPICRDTFPFQFVRANGIRCDYFSPSNFQRHIGGHTQKTNSKRVTRSSNASTKTKAKRKYERKPTRPTKRQQKHDSTSESEDSDADIAKELSKNYLNESDDLAEDDEEMNEVYMETSKRADTNQIEEAGSSSKITNKRKLRKK